MKNVNCVYLGVSTGMSKADPTINKPSKPFWVAQLGIPYGVDGLTAYISGDGYMAKSVFLDSEEEYDSVKDDYVAGEVYPLNILNLGKGTYKWVIS